MKQYNIGCSTDDNYIHHCSTMICSLLENNKDIFVKINLLYENLSEENISFLKNLVDSYNRIITFHKVDTFKLEGVKFRDKRPLSKAAYYRLLLSTILSDLDKVLYLDVDTVILKNIKPLFDIDVENYALAAVKDVQPCIGPHRLSLSLPYNKDYFCSAVMLINLRYWRNNNIEPLLLAFAKKDRYIYCHDQDVLNYAFKDSWFQLSPVWNKFHMNFIKKSEFPTWSDYYEYEKKPGIIHFSSYNPYLGCYFVRYEHLYKKYFELSGCKPIQRKKYPFNKKMKPIIMYYFYNILKRLNIFDEIGRASCRERV